MTWTVNSDQWIDLASLHFNYTVKNNDTNHPLLRVWGSPGVLFDRMIITIGGVTVESIYFYNRTNAMFETCLPTIKRKNLCDLGFGCVAQSDEYQYWNALPIAASSDKTRWS